jgi:N6-L-threonylcarbamoyladenine synthase
VRAVSDVAARALSEAGLTAGDLDGIAVTAGPGLIGSLLVGLSFGKALAYRLGIPVVGVHHLVGHLISAELAEPDLEPPYIGLVVSGGHTALYRVEVRGEPALLGQTRDDAAGEAFDKVAKLLGLPDATTRPPDNRKLLSATVAACSTSWETTILVMPRASFIW